MGKELKRLVEDKVIKSVQFYEWAAPIVPVIRFCEDVASTK